MSKNAPPQSVCLMRLSAIGDVTHALAMVTRIKKAWPETKLTWIIGKIEYQLLKHTSGIEFIVCEKRAKNARAELKRALKKMSAKKRSLHKNFFKNS